MPCRFSKCLKTGAGGWVYAVWHVLLWLRLRALQVFDVFRDNEVSVDVVATSEISVSLTLDQR